MSQTAGKAFINRSCNHVITLPCGVAFEGIKLFRRLVPIITTVNNTLKRDMTNNNKLTCVTRFNTFCIILFFDLTHSVLTVTNTCRP